MRLLTLSLKIREVDTGKIKLDISLIKAMGRDHKKPIEDHYSIANRTFNPGEIWIEFPTAM